MIGDKEKAFSEIRCGKFVARSADHFALSFQIIQIRDGVPRPVCVCGSMPVLITSWTGAGFSQHLQSLN